MKETDLINNKNDENAAQTEQPREPSETEFFESVCSLIQQARRSIERNINTTMVVTYYEIGRRIIEKEQHGENRAQYGKRILQGLSDYLTANLGKGFSLENLRLMRKFFTTYSPKTSPDTAAEISQSAIGKFNPNISWTHYIQLMKITNEVNTAFTSMK